MIQGKCTGKIKPENVLRDSLKGAHNTIKRLNCILQVSFGYSILELVTLLESCQH